MAREYMEKHAQNPHAAAQDLIRWQMTKAATSGFLTNLGGIATLPVALPANITSVLYIQMRMIAAIAIMGGYDVKSDKVRTLIYTSLLGAAATDVLKDAGVRLGEKLTQKALEKMATSVAARLMTKLGLTTAGSMARLVPIAGGVVAAAVDASATKVIGAIATHLFLENHPGKAAGEIVIS
jgi:hypothetical protein